MAYRENIINNMSTRLIILSFVFIASILTAKALGPEQKGVLAYAMNVFILLSAYGHFGVNNVIIYFHKRRAISYPRLMSANALFFFILSFIYGTSFVLVKTADVLFVQYSLTFLTLGAVFILFNYLSVLLKAYYVANENLVAMNRYQLVSEATTLTIMIGFFFFGQLTPFVCLSLFTLPLLLQIFLLGTGERQLFKSLEPGIDTALLKQEIGYGFHAFLSGLFLFLIYSADQFFIHTLLGDASLGVYSVAAGIASCFLFVPESIKTALAGKLYSYPDDDSEKYRYFHKTVRFSVLSCLMMAVTGIIFCPWIIALYGKDFIGGVRALQILMASIVFLSISQLGGIFFYSMGEIRKCTIIAAIACCMNLALNTVLIPGYGIEGAAAASLISYAALAGITLVFLANNKKISLQELLMPQKEDITALKCMIKTVINRKP